ncbi:MAG TPA: indolepyruvate oxidoreductase subunit beta [Methanothrix sp.]|nr:indolepyruvate oxidoreductase subunit beta [Methanothrix sp.]
MNEQTRSIVIVGVGGQGILLASEILAQAAMLEGYDVKTNEVHGMAQRGGSVMAQIRYGKKVHSPLVARNEADILGALEKIEALRYVDYLRPGGLAAVSTQAVMPVSVSSGGARYPENAEELLRKAFPRLLYIDAAKIARDLGDIRTANIVLLGSISQGLDIAQQSWEKAIALCVKEKFLEINRKAFAAGRCYS